MTSGILKKVNWKGISVMPHQIIENQGYYTKDNKKVVYEYRLAPRAKYHVGAETLYADDYVDYLPDIETMNFDSLRHFRMNGTTLIIND